MDGVETKMNGVESEANERMSVVENPEETRDERAPLYTARGSYPRPLSGLAVTGRTHANKISAYGRFGVRYQCPRIERALRERLIWCIGRSDHFKRLRHKNARVETKEWRVARKISASEHTRKVGSRLFGHVESLTNVLNDSSLVMPVLSLGHQRKPTV